MMFYKRDSGVIEIQQSEIYEENPNDACRNFDVNSVSFVTLTSMLFSAYHKLSNNNFYFY